ncbi:MAG: radical SAM protein [Candidatus Omnitrophica bacterium]|nr:radical SAM protein [Candidatus Omnitrophota bacterium]
MLLIRHHFTRSDSTGHYPFVRNISPPLGLVYLATILNENDKNAAIKILDSKALNMTVDQTKTAIKEFKPDMIGITSISEALPGAVELGEICKNLFPDTLRILGGPHMSTNPVPVMKLGLFQLGVIGEGEITMKEIYDAYKNSGEIPTAIKGTCVYKDGNIITNEPRPRILDLDTLPIPNRAFLDNKIYSSYLARRPYTYMMTTRGCPFKCAFCFRTVWGRKVSFTSSRRILEEIKDCLERFKIKEIAFKDDTFTINKKVILELCDMIKKEKLKVRWTVFTRVNTVDEELLKVMKSAGCYKIDFGVESGDQDMLNLMEKGITLEQVRTIFKLCRDLGIQTHAFFMIGYPTETEETAEKTIRFAREIADWVSFAATSCLEGTRLYEFAVKEGYLVPKPINALLGESDVENLCNSPELPTERILQLVNEAYKRFYLRPSHMLRLLGFMIKDGTILNFFKTLPYILSRLFGKFQVLKRNA